MALFWTQNNLSRRRTVVFASALTAASILLAITAVGSLPAFDESSPNASARTGEPPFDPLGGLPPYAVVPYGNEFALTPPMGWNGYNHFGLDVTAQTVRDMARELVLTGMKSLGYVYVNLDGGWDLRERSRTGELQPDPKKFPQGIKPVVDYVHSLGLKFGIYTSAGKRNCANTSAGSFGHYQQDADTFAAWGVDYVKLDWCFMPVREYSFMSHVGLSQMLAKRFGAALAATGRRMVLDINDWIDTSTSDWANSLGNVGRIAIDIGDTYPSMVSNFIHDVAHYRTAGPDHWNDPDMLEVGNPGMTFNEQRTQFTLWAELAAPLIAGNDLSDMTVEARAILTNASVIGVDQDRLGAQGYPVTNRKGHWVLSKPLLDGNRAVVLFNQTDKPALIRTTVADIGLSGAKTYQLQDLWTGEVHETDNLISAFVPPHCAEMYIVAPVA